MANGYGSNTFGNVNADGELTYVKYHFKTDQGVRNMPTNEDAFLAGADPDYANRDLFEAIAGGEFPSWTLNIPRWLRNKLRSTRTSRSMWSWCGRTETFALRKVGRLVLSKNPRNYFAEIEQLTFSPVNTVPGIAPSPDKVLHQVRRRARGGGQVRVGL
jgi:catalase